MNRSTCSLDLLLSKFVYWKFVTVLFLSLGLVPNQLLQAQNQWQHTFGTIRVAGINSVIEGIQTLDNGYLVAGGTGVEMGAATAFLLKFNVSGAIEWYKLYSGFHSFTSVIQTADGGFLAGGRTTGNFPFDHSLLKTDAVGNVTWAQSISNGGQGGITTLAEVSGGYIGSFLSTFRLNLTGDVVLWNRRHIGGGQVNDMAVMADGYVACGDGSFANPAGGFNIVLTKLDTTGGIVWSWAYGRNGYDYAASCVATSDNQIAMAGWTRSFTPGMVLGEGYLNKLAANGNSIWARTYGVSGMDCGIFSGKEIGNGDFVLTGHRGNDLLLMRTGPNGNLLWSKTFGVSSGIGYSVVPATDGGFFITGRGPNRKLIVIKTDSMGNTGCETTVGMTEATRTFTQGANLQNSTMTFADSAHVVQTSTATPQADPCISTGLPDHDLARMQVFPNPAVSHQHLKIVLPTTLEKMATVRVLDARGQEVLQRSMILSSQKHASELVLPPLPPGLIFLQVTVDKLVFREKILLVD